MPITREFIYDDLDTQGLCPAGMENGDPGSGRTVAHDILEHFSFEGDPVENELQALGALFLLRFESGAQLVDASEPLANLLARNVLDVLREMLDNEDLRLPRRRRVHARDCLPESCVHLAVGQALAAMDDAATHYPEWSEARRQALHEHKAALADWLLVGYQRAVQRFGHADVYTLGTTLFQDIAVKADRLMGSGLLSSGDRVRISVDFHQLTVNLRVRSPGHTRWTNAEQFC